MLRNAHALEADGMLDCLAASVHFNSYAAPKYETLKLEKKTMDGNP
jgi:hypothetical protein